MLVLHGGTGFIETMHYQISTLAANHFVIAPDSRAHGRSTDSSSPLSYAQMADDMLELLDRLKISKADFVGWSDGGIVGLDLAIHHPERVGRLVVSGASYDVDGLVSQVTSKDSPCEKDFDPARWFYEHVAPDPRHWPVLYEKIIVMWQTQPRYTLADLGKIVSPTLVMAGEFDCVARSHTDQLAEAIPHSQEQIIKGATHYAPLEQPDIVDREILSFLD